MPGSGEKTRRAFLAGTATAAFAAGLVQSRAAGQARPAVGAGPPVRPVGPDREIRLGFIGTGGRGGALLHGTVNQKESGSIRVVAIAEPFEPHRRKAAARVRQALGQEPEFYTGEEDYRRLIARDDIDAVLIATPCHLHARMYLECFAHGRHFYGEKPMSIDAGDADALVAAQAKNPGVIAQIGFQRRASECYREGVQRIRDGALGPLIAGRACWSNSWGPLGGATAEGTGQWFGRRALSGDWMLEQACHSWDALCWAVGEMPIAATGRGRRDIFTDIDPGRDVTDYYLAQIEFPGGLLLDFEHNWFCPHKADAVFTGVYERLQGPRGGIDLTQGRIYPRDAKAEIIQLTPPRSSGEMTVDALKAFFSSVRTGSPPISGVTNGRQATLAGLLVRKAVDEARRVTMKEVT